MTVAASAVLLLRCAGNKATADTHRKRAKACKSSSVLAGTKLYADSNLAKWESRNGARKCKSPNRRAEPERVERGSDPGPPPLDIVHLGFKKCIDVTSIDSNWDNDVLCTRADGSQFYTSCEGANAFLGY